MNMDFLGNDPMLRQFIIWALGGGMGILVKKIVDWLIEFRQKEHDEISPRTKRWMAYGVSLAVPTVIYGLYVIIGIGPYLLTEHFGAVLAAYAGSQAWHAKTELPTGNDLERAALEKASAIRG